MWIAEITAVYLFYYKQLKLLTVSITATLIKPLSISGRNLVK